MTYQLENKLLAYLGDWAIEKSTLESIKDYLPKIAEFYVEEGRNDPETLDIPMPVREVFTYPIFSEKFCSIMRNEIENIKKTQSFIPNADEDELRQIPVSLFNRQASM